MSATEMLKLANTLRHNARACGADLNAANLFVHEVLLRTIKSGARFDDIALPLEKPAKPPQRAAN